MAFSAPITETIPGEGSRIHVYGTYVNSGGGTGGTINTGLNYITQFKAQPKGAAVVSPPAYNSTLPAGPGQPVAGPNVVIVTNANESGFWEAVGY